MARRHVTLRYVPGFACIGPACEETCCAGWTIAIDEPHHRKLQALMRELGEEARFDEIVVPPPKPPTAKHFAILTQRDDGSCRFLEEDRWCELQRRHGEDHLPDTCATYPRRISELGERIELSATVSCPEIARRALLVEGATDLVPCEPALVGRAVVEQAIDDGVHSPYAASLDLVRGAMYGLLSRAEYPMATRQFFVAELAERLGAFLDAESRTAEPARLAAEVARLETPEALDAAARRFRDADVPPDLGASVLVQVLATRLQGKASETFRRLFGEVIKGVAAAGGGIELLGGHLEGARVSAPALGAHLEARRAEREARFGDRLDLYLENYARNWVMNDWFVFSPSLARHLQHHLVRVAVIRFLLLGHPGLDQAAAAGADALDRLAVEVFYSTARSLEHSEAMVRSIVDDLLGELPPIVAAVALLRV